MRRSFLATLVAFSLVGLLSTQQAFAQVPTVHELHLIADIESAPLDLVDRGLAPSGRTYQVTVITPPAHGLLVGEEFEPHADFWNVGADQLTVAVTPSGGVETRHTFLFAPAHAGNELESFEEDFDLTSELSAWTEQGDTGVLSYLNPGIQGTSLRAYMFQAGAAASIGRGLPPESEGVHGLGAAGTTITGPPDNILTDPAVPGWVNIATAGPNESEVAVYVQLKSDGGSYTMRASTQPDGDVTCPSCATPWQTVPPMQEVAFRLWTGPTVISDDGGRAPMLRFDLDLPGTANDTFDWLEGFHDVSYGRYGFHQSSGLVHVEVLYDKLRSWREDLTFAPQALVFDDFEDGGAANSWAIDGPVAVDSSAALNGAWGAEVNVAALRQGLPRDALLLDALPNLNSSVTEIGAQMTVDLSSLGLDNGESLRLLCGSKTNVIEGGIHFSIIVYRNQNVYKIWARARQNNGFMHKTPIHDLTTDQPRLSLRWRTAAAGDGGGTIALWIDGVSAGEISGFGNELKTLESLSFGVFKPTLAATMNNGNAQVVKMDDLLVIAR